MKKFNTLTGAAAPLMTANVNLTRVMTIGAGDKGISLGENANPKVTDCRLLDCVTGIAIKDASNPLIENTVIEDCRVGVAGYDKNWRYPGGGDGRLLGCTLRGNRLDVSLDGTSSLTLEGCTTEQRFSVPVGRESALRILDGNGGSQP